MQPSADALARACQAIGWRGLRLDPQARTLAFAHPGMRIDLGGFAKGHAVDNATATCCAAMASRMRASAPAATAASSATAAAAPGHRYARIRAGPVAWWRVLPLIDTAVSTSGDYERFFERDGVRHHHIIDPATGRSPADIHSVTILAADGLTAEALSKSVFVLGVERGMALIESQPGVDAVVVDAQGQLHYSTGLLAPQGA